MALDYSKLSDEELEAIANDDYSKLSDKTLNAIASETGAIQTPSISAAPQAVSAAARTLGPVVPAAGNVLGTAAQAVMNAPLTSVTAPFTHPISTGMGAVRNIAGAVEKMVPMVEDIKSYDGGAISEKTMRPMTIGEGAAAAGSKLKGLGGRLVQGAIAPESSFLLPYQMAAYEQEKIRQNPNAPEYANNPYAQAYRGEYATQGAAAAANRRQAIAGQQYGGLTPAEQAILEKDRLNMLMRLKAAKKVLGQE